MLMSSIFASNISNKNNELLSAIVAELSQISVELKDDSMIKRVENIANRMNKIIIENRQNVLLIINYISKLETQMKLLNKSIKELKSSNNISTNITIQKIKYENGEYIGEVLNGLREGKGTMLFENGDKYIGDWINDKVEGKGIYYFITGEIYDGEWINNNREGKGILYYSKGDRYEGDWKNGKRDGEGIIYYINGDRQMGDFKDDKEIGKHVLLNKSGDIETNNY